MMFSPKFWSEERKNLFLLLLLITVLAFYAIFHSVRETYYAVGMISELANVILMTLVVFGTIWLVAIFSSLWTVEHEKIEVEDDLLKSTSQLMLRPSIFKVINLKAIKTIKDRDERQVVPTGKSLMVILIYHLVFEQLNGDKQEISMVGWDKESVKEMLLYINGKYPDIFIQTYAFREPSEKILKDYLPLVKKIK